MIKNKQEILNKVEFLIKMYKNGELGGEIMPEDANPHLDPTSKENYLYFTLPMALNYRRNSYKLWESALATYQDNETNFVFKPAEVITKNFDEVQAALTKYKLTLFKVRQTDIWIKLSCTIYELFNGDIRNLFEMFNNDVIKIRNFMQKDEKARFPYLSGTKLCNYWLHVIYMYGEREYLNPEAINVAPDTHVIKATHKLGLINDHELDNSDIQLIIINKWNELFKGTKYKPIDIHTILWLWSRNGFKEIE